MVEKIIRTELWYNPGGYEFLDFLNNGKQRLRECWSGRQRPTGILQALNDQTTDDEVLVPKKTDDERKKLMPENTWVDFYNLAQETKVCTENYDLNHVKQSIIRFANKHGDFEILFLKEWIESLRFMNDLYHARKEGDTEELHNLIYSGEGLASMLTTMNLYIGHKDKESRAFIKPTDGFQALILDFLFSKGMLQKWLRCEQCGSDFKAKRRRKYCKPKCKRRAQYERDQLKGGKA